MPKKVKERELKEFQSKNEVFVPNTSDKVVSHITAVY